MGNKQVYLDNISDSRNKDSLIAESPNQLILLGQDTESDHDKKFIVYIDTPTASSMILVLPMIPVFTDFLLVILMFGKLIVTDIF